MKKAFLLMVVPALLAALAFAQTPAAGNTDQTNIKGCVASAGGDYTVVEDNTGHIFKVSASSVDLKPHVGHDVALSGQKASGEGSGADANSFAVTELTMISEHCAGAAAAPAAAAAAPAETGVPPAAAAPAPAAAPAAAAGTPAESAAAPAPIATEPVATVTAAETAVTPVTPTPPVTPAPVAAEPAAPMSAPEEIASTPPAASVHAKPASAGRKLAATPAAAATKTPARDPDIIPSETAGTPAAAATSPAATTSSAPDGGLAPAATTPAKPGKTGSFAIFIAFGVLVLLLGILAPVFRRWRKQRLLEETDAPNLSFTNDTKPDTKSDQDRRDPPVPRKAA